MRARASPRGSSLRRAGLLLAILGVATSARADVRLVGIVPPAPNAGQAVAIRVALGPYDEDWGFYSELDGRVVRAYLTLGDLYQPPQGDRTRDCPLGAFAPGRYTVELYANGGMPVRVGSATLVVAPIAAPIGSAWLVPALASLIAFAGSVALRRRAGHSS